MGAPPPPELWEGAITDAQLRAVNAMDGTLRVLMDRNDIPTKLQGIIAEMGFNNVRIFSNTGEDAKEVRKWIEDHVTIKPDNAPRFVMMARILATWESAMQRKRYVNVAEAEATYNRQPKVMPKNDHSELVQLLFTKVGAQETRHIPGLSLIEKLLERIESIVFKAEIYLEIVNMDEDVEDNAQVMQDSRGNLMLRKAVSGKGIIPPSPEVLRDRIRILANAWIMAMIRNPSTGWLQGLTLDVFEKHLGFVLGEQILGLCVKDGDGTVLAKVSFAMVLRFEYELRKAALKRVSKIDASKSSDTLAQAFIDVRADASLKEQHITTPLALSRSEPGSVSTPPGKPPRQRGRKASQWKDNDGPFGQRFDPYVSPGKGAGKTSPKGKGKGRKGKNAYPQPMAVGATNRLRVTKAGLQICFAFNQDGEWCAHPCYKGFQHVCWWCEGPHQGWKCPTMETFRSTPPAGGTDGSAAAGAKGPLS